MSELFDSYEDEEANDRDDRQPIPLAAYREQLMKMLKLRRTVEAKQDDLRLARKSGEVWEFDDE